MLFSIITVTKHNEAGFTRTRASVQAQDFTDFEWVVVDGAVEPDGGIYDAMNKGLARARGTYVIFMNAGDQFAHAHVLDHVAQFLRAQAAGVDVLYGDAIEGGMLKPARHNIRYGMITHHQAIFYRRTRLKYDTQYPIAADYKFTAQAMAQGRARYMPQPVCIFEQGGISQRRAAQGRYEQALIRRELGMAAPGARVAQVLSLTLKRVAPGLYWRIRKRA